MEDSTYKKWDIAIKIFGIIGTSAAFIIGITANSKMESKKNFWTSQNQVYTEICNNAGAMVANIDNQSRFEQEKINFLTHYYGEIVLVEDTSVEKCLVDIQSAIYDINIHDQKMVNDLKIKVLALSNACKNSSTIFKQSKL